MSAKISFGFHHNCGSLVTILGRRPLHAPYNINLKNVLIVFAILVARLECHIHKFTGHLTFQPAIGQQ